jgi:hypothetical protein
VRGLADRRVIHAQIAADGANDNLTRVQSHADLHVNAAGTLDILGVLLHRLLHAQGGVAGTHAVIFMGERGAEERHDAVAHHLVHGALVAVDSFHHELEDRIQQLARFLWVSVGKQLHRAFYVGEQHGDLLPFALEGGF